MASSTNLTNSTQQQPHHPATNVVTNVTHFEHQQAMMPNIQLHQGQQSNGFPQQFHPSPDLIQGSPISRHSYVNQAVNFSPAHYSTLQTRQIIRSVPLPFLKTPNL